MSLKINIIDSKTRHEAYVDFTLGEEQALVVATRPLKLFNNKVVPFINPTFGVDLAITAGFFALEGDVTSFAQEVIYTENAEWTTSSVSGVWDFASAAQTHAGIVSIDATGTVNNSTAQLAKGSSYSLSNSSALSGWIYITAWPVTGVKEVNIQGWNTSAVGVGSKVNIGNYINTALFNTWQKFTISLSDISLVGTTIDAIRITTVDTGQGSAPDYYLDDIIFEPVADIITDISGVSGVGVQEYTISPSLGK